MDQAKKYQKHLKKRRKAADLRRARMRAMCLKREKDLKRAKSLKRAKVMKRAKDLKENRSKSSLTFLISTTTASGKAQRLRKRKKST